MTSSQQRAELQRRIWQIANDVRGAVDGWDFKQYVLGTLFYRFISENFVAYIEGGDDSVDYAGLSDVAITLEIKDDAVKTKGYFIYPSQLFSRVYHSRIINFTSHSTLSNEAAAQPTPAEQATVKLLTDHLKNKYGFWREVVPQPVGQLLPRQVGQQARYV